MQIQRGKRTTKLENRFGALIRQRLDLEMKANEAIKEKRMHEQQGLRVPSDGIGEDGRVKKAQEDGIRGSKPATDIRISLPLQLGW